MITAYSPGSHLLLYMFYLMMAVLGSMVAVELFEGLYLTFKRRISELRDRPSVVDEASWAEGPTTTFRLEKPEGAARRHFFHRLRMRNFSWSKPSTRLVGEAPPRARPRIGSNR